MNHRREEMKKIIGTEKQVERAILMGVSSDKTVVNIEDSLQELVGLATTAGVEVVAMCFQNIKDPNAATLIGKGKVKELAEIVEHNNADIVIFDCELSGSQINNISEAVGAKVIDRSILILDIFAGRATSNEGKLQVQLAQLKYTLPRLSGLTGTSGRFGGGVGMRGPGETKLELDKRVIKENILKLEAEIDKLKSQRALRQSNRIKNNKKVVAIVGYTNAGKSTLMNLLTKADIYADDKLFATLDTTTRSLWLDNGKEILLTDTVGFIDKLPHAFIDAFASTLEETKLASLIIHVVDVTNPEHEKQEEVVLKVLKDLGVDKTPIITVYNKIDKALIFKSIKSDDEVFGNGERKYLTRIEDVKKQVKAVPKDVITISAKKNIGIEELKDRISRILFS